MYEAVGFGSTGHTGDFTWMAWRVNYILCKSVIIIIIISLSYDYLLVYYRQIMETFQDLRQHKERNGKLLALFMVLAK